MKVFWALMALIAVAAVVMLTTELGGTDANPANPKQRPDAAASEVRKEFVSPITLDAEPENAAIKRRIDERSKPVEHNAPAPVEETFVKIELPPESAAVAPERPHVPVVPSATPVSKGETAPEIKLQTEVHGATDAKPEAKPNSNPASTPETKPEAKPETKPDSGAAADATDNLLLKIRNEIEAERKAAEARRAAAAHADEQKGAAVSAAPAKGVVPPAVSGLFGEAAAEQKADGSLLVDGKYVVAGKGTKENPFKVTWDHLISAERDYAPKDGKKTIPARIQALDDKWVELTGYVAFPLMSAETDEMLSMMNQWDGCCIGIPPTPYDAIEVRLSEPVSGDARLTTYGVVQGKFKVDPHLVGGWLVGLYVIDQGKLTPKAYGGVAP